MRTGYIGSQWSLCCSLAFSLALTFAGGSTGSRPARRRPPRKRRSSLGYLLGDAPTGMPDVLRR